MYSNTREQLSIVCAAIKTRRYVSRAAQEEYYNITEIGTLKTTLTFAHLRKKKKRNEQWKG